MTVLLAAPVDDGGELTLRAQSLLRESAWFVRCEGEADLARLGVVLRVGMIVAIEGVGCAALGKISGLERAAHDHSGRSQNEIRIGSQRCWQIRGRWSRRPAALVGAL